MRDYVLTNKLLANSTDLYSFRNHIQNYYKEKIIKKYETNYSKKSLNISKNIRVKIKIPRITSKQKYRVHF